LEAPPLLPVLEAGDFLDAGDGACTVDEDAVAACLTSNGAMKIDRALEDLKYYADNALTLCGQAEEIPE
jgi:hypothetical protein